MQCSKFINLPQEKPQYGDDADDADHDGGTDAASK